MPKTNLTKVARRKNSLQKRDQEETTVTDLLKTEFRTKQEFRAVIRIIASPENSIEDSRNGSMLKK